MTAEDTYKTIIEPSEGIYTEKRSKFIAIALPVRTLDEIKMHLETYQKKYYDARHVCYAYMLGAARKDFRANDNGEPSGTAGKPILGQINSNELTDILIIVVRYFGGIKLGTSGLIVAYKAAAAEAIAAATIIEKTVDEDVTVMFEYPFMNDVSTPSGGSPNVALSVLLPPSHVSCIAISRASIRQPSSTTVTTSPTS